MGELKFSENSLYVLGISTEQCTSIQIPYSNLQLSYLEYLLEHFSSGNTEEDIFDKQPILPLLRVVLNNGDNILHLFSVNISFLQLYTKEIIYHITELGTKNAINYAYYSLILSADGMNPFNYAMKGFVQKAFECMLEILAEKKNSDLLLYIRKHLF